MTVTGCLRKEQFFIMNKNQCKNIHDILDKYIGTPTNIMSKSQVEVYREYKDLFRTYQVYSGVLFCLMKSTKLNGLQTMFSSCEKQKKLLQALVITLKKYTLEKYEIEICMKNIKSFSTRLTTIRLIVKENLLMTEFYPYYQELCKKEDVFDEIANDIKVEEDAFILRSNEYNLNHPDIYNSHLVVMKQAIDNYNKAQEIRENKKKEEKLQKMQKEKEERDMLNEIKKNRRANKTRDTRLGKCGNSYYYN